MKTQSPLHSLPVVVIGAGPVGLAAAANLAERSLPFVVLEAGPAVGAAMRQWSHVQLFSPWGFNLDPAAERLLLATGWKRPPEAEYPNGGDVVARYLEPLSRVPALAGRIRLGTRVTGVARLGRDKLKADHARGSLPFRVRVASSNGEAELLARAVIDTSGTWARPNPLGADGLPALGEIAARERVRYGIPDVLRLERARYAGKRVLVVGSGHSAFNVLVDLVQLAAAEPGTRITWVVRRPEIGRLFGGGSNDKLLARGELGAAVSQLVDAGSVRLLLGFAAERVEQKEDGLVVWAGDRSAGPVDEIVVATGFRPDFSFLSEVQLGLDSIVESTPALAPMIDPNLHSCGTVRPHGHRELAHPEAGFYIAGMKSYGRAPTFLMRTGYEQVRSIVAALAGDTAAADRVELVLPETGVCSLSRALPAAADCCGGAPKLDTAACCREDELAKEAGTNGCGCAEPEPAQAAAAGRCCG